METCRTLAGGIVECTTDDSADGISDLTALIFVAYWLFGLALCLYAGRDMERRGQPAIVWAALVFFGGAIGVIIWRLLRKNYPVLPPPPPAPESPYGAAVPPGRLPWSDWGSTTGDR